MINHDLTLTEAVAVYKITNNTELAKKIVDKLANANTHTLMQIEKLLENQSKDFDFGEFLEMLEAKKTNTTTHQQNWSLDFDPDGYILVDIDTPNGTEIAAWNEMRGPRHNEEAIIHIGNEWKDKGKITRAYFTTKLQWGKYYIAEPLDNRTIDKAHDPNRKLFARVAFTEHGKVYDYLWDSDVAYDERPTEGDMVMVETPNGYAHAILVEFVFQEPNPKMKYKYACTEDEC